MRTPSSVAIGRPVVLIALGAFWPGNESAGPNLSIRGLCETLGDSFEFKVLARDRPFGAERGLTESGVWQKLPFCEILYMNPASISSGRPLDVIRKAPHDLLLLNGFFDREFTIPSLFLRRLSPSRRQPTVVSPRGEFGGGALALKGHRKALYLALVRTLGLLNGVTLHATSEQEALDIRGALPFAADIKIAPNVRTLFDRPNSAGAAASEVDCRLAFLGRITPVKNLDYALRTLASARARVSYDIFGPVGDASYWEACRKIIQNLPPNIAVRYRGEIANDDVPNILAEYDALFLPTRGENFGHAIFEALGAGIPVIISDQTPWQDLERSFAGWNLPLAHPMLFTAAIDRLAHMSAKERAELRDGARTLAEKHTSENDAVERMRDMLLSALSE